MSKSKDVIYIESEDDITAVIEKMSASKAGILALVLPKRYATLKSSVNMKLLKKTAAKSKKKLVLITSEDALLPLAGAAGIHVADSLKSRPAVPHSAAAAAKEAQVIDEAEDIDPAASIEELGKGKKAGSTAASEKSEKIRHIKGSSKIKVPNFNSFRLRIMLAILAVVLLASGWYVAFNVLPTANVQITAQTTRVPTEVAFTLNPNADSDDIEKKIVTGIEKSLSKTVTERFEATGEKDIGKKASGIMTVNNCDTDQAFTLPKGTVFTDNTNGFDFTSNKAVQVPGGSFSVVGGSAQCDAAGSVDVNVTAVKSGDSRNLSPRGYSVGGVSGLVTGYGGSMTGGTSQVVKVVSNEDITKATEELRNKTDENVRAELTAQFNADDVVVIDTFTIDVGTPEPSVAAGTEADEASISAEFTYSVLGVSADVMSQILEQEQEKTFNSEEQSILDSGVAAVEVVVLEKLESGAYELEAATDGYIGPEINTELLAEQIEGRRFSDAVDFIRQKPGVSDVNLDLKPFWVFSVPSPEKTTITIEIPSDEAEANQ